MALYIGRLVMVDEILKKGDARSVDGLKQLMGPVKQDGNLYRLDCPVIYNGEQAQWVDLKGSIDITKDTFERQKPRMVIEMGGLAGKIIRAPQKYYA